MRRAVIGLGTNLGDRLTTLESAVRALGRVGEVQAISGVYETAPVGTGPQPHYLNAAVRLGTSLPAADLLEQLLGIERAHGRERRIRWDARTLDLDILWIDGEFHATGELCVPHPRLVERAFALLPLVEVCPDALDPSTGTPYATLCAGLSLKRPVARLDRLIDA